MSGRYHAPIQPWDLQKEILEKHGWSRGDETSWDLLVADLGDDPDVHLRTVRAGATMKRVSAINGWRFLANKAMLWATLEAALGREAAETLSPPTWLVQHADQRRDLKARHTEDSLYLVKHPGRGRRQGIKLARTVPRACAHLVDGYTVVQQVKPDVIRVAGHALSLRLYLTVTRSEGQIWFWLHERGKCLYSPQPKRRDPYDPEVIVSHSPKDGKRPIAAPYDLDGLWDHLESYGVDPGVAWSNIASVVEGTCRALLPALARVGDFGSTVECHQLFGLDLILDTRLNAWMLEANRGPDLQGKTRRDRDLKRTIIEDTWILAGALPWDRSIHYMPVCHGPVLAT